MKKIWWVHVFAILFFFITSIVALVKALMGGAVFFIVAAIIYFLGTGLYAYGVYYMRKKSR